MLVSGKGFTATKASDASKFSESEVECKLACAADLGYSVTKVEVQDSSWGVTYIRKGYLGTDGKITQKAPDRNKGEIDPSKRRFATRKEAIQHGSRFAERRATKGDQPGTAGHIGFYVAETNDPVNAEINWTTGLTNALV